MIVVGLKAAQGSEDKSASEKANWIALIIDRIGRLFKVLTRKVYHIR